MFKTLGPVPCTLKNYEFIINGKWTDSVVSKRLACTNTLAWTNKHTNLLWSLHIMNLPGAQKLNIKVVWPKFSTSSKAVLQNVYNSWLVQTRPSLDLKTRSKFCPVSLSLSMESIMFLQCRSLVEKAFQSLTLQPKGQRRSYNVATWTNCSSCGARVGQFFCVFATIWQLVADRVQDPDRLFRVFEIVKVDRFL